MVWSWLFVPSLDSSVLELLAALPGFQHVICLSLGNDYGNSETTSWPAHSFVMHGGV